MIRSKRTLMSSAVAGTMFLSLALGGAALAQKYEATMYVAGMGGHFADAKLTIEPEKDTPITITELGKLDIGDGETHPVHDARIDKKDRNTMYWSTYKLDKDAGSVTHVGKSDLSTGEVITDVTVKTPAGVLNTSKMYCASGQSDSVFMPISMSQPGFITVADKKTLKVKASNLP